MYLKSNMDRFIDYHHQKPKYQQKHLKSNMDRFIAGFLLLFKNIITI